MSLSVMECVQLYDAMVKTGTVSDALNVTKSSSKLPKCLTTLSIVLNISIENYVGTFILQRNMLYFCTKSILQLSEISKGRMSGEHVIFYRS